jgi:pseudouridine-5'-phosphate glycosidase
VDYVISEDGKSIYVKCRPLDWAKKNVLTPSYMENTYTLCDGYVKVDNRFVDFSGYTHRNADQELPAFYTRTSGHSVDYRLDTPKEIADAFRVKMELGLAGGMLVTNPIPEEYSMDPAVINKAIDTAIREAEEQGIKGKDTTPFLLAKVKELTGGDSLESNINLVYNNAKLGALVANELAK